ncbi:hypothetical protein ACWDZ4_13815 [Streptomyces sp. NPDC003016]
MPEQRREQLEEEEIDAYWCPASPVTWQWCLHLTRLHLDDGGTLPATVGEVVRQGENPGRWVTTARLGWDQLTGVRQRSRATPLPPERMEQLSAIGMRWG